MIQSLLGNKLNSINMLNTDMTRRSGESSTLSRSYGKYKNRLHHCSEVGLTHLKTIKVIQDEESNYVMLKEDKKSGKLYVEKSARNENSFENELEFFKHYDPENIYFPTLSCFMNTIGREDRFSVITEFIRGRDSHLLAAIATKEELKSMVAQLLNSVADLHRMGYIHADIKPGNVLVSDDFKVTLIDFGMTTRVGHAKSHRGSPYTRAPELHEMCPGRVDVGIDWWAFGATVAIWYYYHHNPQYVKAVITNTEMSKVQIAKNYFEAFSQYEFTPMKWSSGRFQAGIFPSSPSFDEETREFLALFLTIDPEFREFDTERLLQKLRNHRFFKNIDWSSL